MTYDAFARRVVATGILTDPWTDGRPRFREEPVVLDSAGARALYRASEDVASAYNELCLIVAEAPHFLDDFFGLTSTQKTMWLASQPMWHGLARADVFQTDQGLAFTELNCDTPTGEAEAVVLNALVLADHPGAIDPNCGLEARFLAMVGELAERTMKARDTRSIGIVYPTEFTEDLALVRLYKRWFEDGGYRVTLGSPYNLTHDAGGMVLFDNPFSIMVRHYKTDWWGERASVWDDEKIPDVEPLHAPLGAVLSSVIEGRGAVVNPFGAVVPQNKRSMAFMWEQIHRFSQRSQEIIRRFIPVTARLETLHREQLFGQREDWVIKSDYGAEGDEVIVGRFVSDEVWRASIAHARPGRWIAQRYFSARTSERGETVNHGVYLVAGQAAGIYARVQAGPTDDHAVSAPVLVVS